MSTTTPEINCAVNAMVSDIISAYVSNNHVAATDLPALVATVHAAITGVVAAPAVKPVKSTPEKLTPAQIRKSVISNAIISFIDGGRYKTLKRHLTVHGLTPDTYGTKFGLPSDYPMVSAAYSEVRSGLAKSLGLGNQNRSHDKTIETVISPKARKRAA